MKEIKVGTVEFLKTKLLLEINAKDDIIIWSKRGLKFLGVGIFSFGRRLNKRNWPRAVTRVNAKNLSSYSGPVKQHSKEERLKEFDWVILDKLNSSH